MPPKDNGSTFEFIQIFDVQFVFVSKHMIKIKWYPIYLLLMYILLQFKFLCGCNTMRFLTPYTCTNVSEE